jgi:hypothetical protein
VPLRPAATIVGERLAQTGAVARLLDVHRRDPPLWKQLAREQRGKRAGVEPIVFAPRRRPRSARACTARSV